MSLNKKTQQLLENAVSKYNTGRYSDAQKICKKVLKAEPNNPYALNLIGVCLMNTGQAHKALQPLLKASSLEPANSDFQNNLAGAYTLNIRSQSNLIIEKGIESKKINDFVGLLKAVSLEQPNADTQTIRQALYICLESLQGENQDLAMLYMVFLKHDPFFKELAEACAKDDTNIDVNEIDRAKLLEVLSDPFFVMGIKKFFAFGVNFEKMLTFMRRYLLFHHDSLPESVLPFLTALAEKCYLNEYVFYVREEEEKILSEFVSATLKDLGKEKPEIAVLYLSLISCYRPLGSLKCKKEMLNLYECFEDEGFKNLVNLQIIKPDEREDLKAGIPTLSDIKDSISQNVRAQYEEHPYPTWQYIELPELTSEQINQSKGLNMLVAGCGTGQELVSVASAYPRAHVTGIDLSFSSLSYAKQKTMEYDLNNVEFLQADILELNKLDQRFDFITCSGVLHHMENPEAGLKKLLGLLKDDGVLSISLYSEIARRNVVEARQWVEDKGYKADAVDMRQFRRDVMDMIGSGTLLSTIIKFSDFYDMSMLRDLVFHVQEHRFTITQLRKLLKDNDLELLFMTSKDEDKDAQYKAAYPDDVQMNNFDTWGKFEEENPDTFKKMYTVFCMKSGGSRPDWLYVR